MTAPDGSGRWMCPTPTQSTRRAPDTQTPSDVPRGIPSANGDRINAQSSIEITIQSAWVNSFDHRYDLTFER